jgi:uncharacterized protein with von Willebrand factor type A (vWA) domain
MANPETKKSTKENVEVIRRFIATNEDYKYLLKFIENDGIFSQILKDYHTEFPYMRDEVENWLEEMEGEYFPPDLARRFVEAIEYYQRVQQEMMMNERKEKKKNINTIRVFIANNKNYEAVKNWVNNGPLGKLLKDYGTEFPDTRELVEDWLVEIEDSYPYDLPRRFAEKLLEYANKLSVEDAKKQ